MLLDQGADGLAVFGTTSEANSLGLEERMALLEHLIDSGISAEALMPGTGTTALPDTVRLTSRRSMRETVVGLGLAACHAKDCDAK